MRRDGSAEAAEGFAAIGLNADEMISKICGRRRIRERPLLRKQLGLASMDDPLAQSKAGIDLFGSAFEDIGR